MTRVKMYCFIIVSLLVLLSCDHPMPKPEEIIGTWKSSDGAILKFEKNNALTVSDLNTKNFDSSENGIFNGSGTWEVSLENNVSPWQVISVYAKNDKTSIGNNLVIERENYITGSGDIKYIFVWIGDPDSENRYIFYKIKP